MASQGGLDITELNAHALLKSREVLYNVGDVLRLRPEFGGMDAWVQVRSLRLVDGLFEATAIGARIESEAFSEVDGELVANVNFGLPSYIIEGAVRSIAVEGGG